MAKRTTIDLLLIEYGRSVLDAPLLWLPCAEKCRLLIIAGVHGEEPETTVTLSRAVRSCQGDGISPHVGVIFCANPDGVALGTRGNANGVDLNRNFPSSNWQSEPTTCRWHADEGEVQEIGTGSSAGSEPESQALLSLLRENAPDQVLTLHGPLACVDDPLRSPLGSWIAAQSGLPLVGDIGYATPGSMGTWAAERDLPWITWEFPPHGIEPLSKSCVPLLKAILSGDIF
jgi:murein peptide amidase A